MANFLKEIAKHNPTRMDRNLMGRVLSLPPGLFNEEHVRMIANSLPIHHMYQVRPYKNDLEASYFEPENIVAPSWTAADFEYGLRYGKPGDQFEMDEVQGPLPRDYYRTIDDEKLLDVLYPQYRERILGDLKDREKAMKDLQKFQKACANGTAEEAWTNPFTGRHVYCGLDAVREMEEMKDEFNMKKGAREMLPSDEEIMMDPQMYVDTEVSPVRRKALKLINGED